MELGCRIDATSTGSCRDGRTTHSWLDNSHAKCTGGHSGLVHTARQSCIPAHCIPRVEVAPFGWCKDAAFMSCQFAPSRESLVVSSQWTASFHSQTVSEITSSENHTRNAKSLTFHPIINEVRTAPTRLKCTLRQRGIPVISSPFRVLSQHACLEG